MRSQFLSLSFISLFFIAQPGILGTSAQYPSYSVLWITIFKTVGWVERSETQHLPA